MSEVNKYGQGDNHTMEARIIRNPAFEESDEQWVKARYRGEVREHADGSVWQHRTEGYGDFALDSETRLGSSFADARRRLEPEPDAEAKECLCINPVCEDCPFHSIAAYPKPDAAGEDAVKRLAAEEFCASDHAGPTTDCTICLAIQACRHILSISAPRNSALEEAAKGDQSNLRDGERLGAWQNPVCTKSCTDADCCDGSCAQPKPDLSDLLATVLEDKRQAESQLSDLREAHRKLDHIAALTARAEKAEETIGEIADWCEAYPVEIFGGKPDMKEVRRLLGDKLLSQLSADNFLHVLNGIKRIITRTNP